MSDNSSEFNKDNQLEPNYWRSFNELYRDQNFIDASYREFSEQAKEDFSPGSLGSFSRRKFLALLGASAALAGAGCSHRDKGEIIPYNRKPEEILPGNPNYYASTCTGCSAGCGILIKTREGRPIKIDGNPLHPVNLGKICTKGQASILNLYDPERIKSPMKKVQGGSFIPVDWQDADYAIINELSKAGNKEIALITGKLISPSAVTLIQEFIGRYPSTRVYSYEVNNNLNKLEAAGENNLPVIKWNEARIIVSLESDFLGTGPDKIENARLFAEGRDINNTDRFNRLYVVEGGMTLTGMNADYRIRLNPLYMDELITLLKSQLNGGNDGDLKDFASRHGVSEKKLGNLIRDLNQYKGQSIIYAGNSLPAHIQKSVNELNDFIGARNLYRTDVSSVSLHPLLPMSSFSALVDKMNNDGVAVIIHFDTNPVFHFPHDINYRNGLKKVPMSVTLTELENETSFESDYVLPIHHNFEAWGDAKTRTGFYSLQQPVIYPLLNTRQKEAVLLTWLNGKADKYNENLYHDYLVNKWQIIFSGGTSNFTEYWNNALHDGVVFTSNEPAIQQFPAVPAQQINSSSEKKKFTIVFRESYAIGDGRYANNGWLQELPHPVSKVTWDNYASVSYKTAKEIDVKTNDLIEININGRMQELPVVVQPGDADNTITIETGYGRYRAGIVAEGVGFNVFPLMSGNGGYSQWIYTTDSVKKTGGTYKLASSQEHHLFDDDLTRDQLEKRKIVKEGTLDQYKKNRNFLKDTAGHEQPSVLGTHLDELYAGLKWGMAIDMNRCLGCGECVIACNVENNVPIVGKDQVLVSREMQWLRIDRYYAGSPEDPRVVNQPMLCQHCDHAPCENVCPVVATTHSTDGLNQMAYNRCVGTRYCSNNCPYKVRRFNFFNFRDHFRDGYQENNIISLIHNPEVTVRSRGVMEKCTFCIQRIMKGREDAIRDKREFKGTDITSACQDACITNAITFGDINEKTSPAGKLRDHELGYYVLEELNTRPNITYLAKLRNIDQEAS